MSNRILGAVMILVIGLGMMVFGALFAFETVVKCDDKVMQPGDTCKKHKQPTRTYEERRNLDHTMGWVVLGVGSVVAIAGVGLGIRAAVSRPAAPVSMPPSGPVSYPPRGASPQYPPQYPPPPGGQPYYPPPRYPPPGPPWPPQ
nr:hypothetical protein [Mycobacterium gordonae]